MVPGCRYNLLSLKAWDRTGETFSGGGGASRISLLNGQLGFPSSRDLCRQVAYGATPRVLRDDSRPSPKRSERAQQAEIALATKETLSKDIINSFHSSFARENSRLFIHIAKKLSRELTGTIRLYHGCTVAKGLDTRSLLEPRTERKRDWVVFSWVLTDPSR